MAAFADPVSATPMAGRPWRPLEPRRFAPRSGGGRFAVDAPALARSFVRTGLVALAALPMLLVVSLLQQAPLALPAALAVGHLAAARGARRGKAASAFLALPASALCLAAAALIGAGATSPADWAAAGLAVLFALLPAALLAADSRSRGHSRSCPEIAVLDRLAPGEAVFLIDPSGRFLGATRAARRFALLRDLAPGDDFLRRVPVVDRPALLAALHGADAAGPSPTVLHLSDAGAKTNSTIRLQAAEGGRIAVGISERSAATVADAEAAAAGAPGDGPPDPVCQDRDVADVNEAVLFAFRLLDAEAAGRRVPLKLEAAETVLVACETRACRQILLNLVGNAIRHGAEASDVVVRLRRTRGAVLIRVLNDGDGLTAEECAALLAPYRRGSTADASGSGLGLAIVRELVEANGGSILLHSDGGRGLRVDVRLPLPEGVAASDGERH